MGLKNILMERIAKIADLNFDNILSETRDKAREHGYNVTFEGEFRQAPEGQPETQIRFPFVVAQSNDQRARLSEGALEGRVYDAGIYAMIHGTINEDSVRFGKLYDEGSVENPEQVRKGIEMIQGVLEAVGEPSKVRHDHLVNLHVIAYEGKRTDKLSELEYSGNWSFNSDSEDMEQRGIFSMRATDPTVIKSLSRE